MKVIRKFQTVDGKEFTDETEARKHEIEIDTMSQLKNLLKLSISSHKVQPGNIDNVLKHILDESAAFSQILQSYRKKQPRQPQEFDSRDSTVKIPA